MLILFVFSLGSRCPWIRGLSCTSFEICIMFLTFHLFLFIFWGLFILWVFEPASSNMGAAFCQLHCFVFFVFKLVHYLDLWRCSLRWGSSKLFSSFDFLFCSLLWKGTLKITGWGEWGYSDSWMAVWHGMGRNSSFWAGQDVQWLGQGHVLSHIGLGGHLLGRGASKVPPRTGEHLWRRKFIPRS